MKNEEERCTWCESILPSDHFNRDEYGRPVCNVCWEIIQEEKRIEKNA